MADTPVRRVWHEDEGSRIHLKLEGHNPTGSIKDRLAACILSTASAEGLLQRGAPVVAVSTGNTGIALSRVSRMLGLRCEVLLPASTGAGVVQRVRRFGGTPVLIPDDLGPQHASAEARRRAFEGWYWPNQVGKGMLTEAYESLAASVVRQVPDVDCLVCALGTGATLLGLGSGVRRLGKSHLHVVAVRAARAESIVGLRPSDVPSLCSLRWRADEIMDVTRHAAEQARRLLACQGIRCSASGGAVYHAALRLVRDGRWRSVVGICADGIDMRLDTAWGRHRDGR